MDIIVALVIYVVGLLGALLVAATAFHIVSEIVGWAWLRLFRRRKGGE